MLRKIVLHGALQARFGSSFELDVKSPAEAVRALIVQLKGFRNMLRDGHYRVIRARYWSSDTLDIDEMKLRLGRSRELHIVPVLAGSSSAWGKIITGIAIVGLAIAAPYALGIAGGLSATIGGISAIGFSGISFGTIAGFGALMALSGVAQILSPTPTPAAASSPMDSFLFGSSQNVTSQGGVVPTVFGEFVTGSVVISSGLSSEDFSSANTLGVAVIAALSKHT